MAGIRRLLSPRGRGRRVTVPNRTQLGEEAREPSRGGGGGGSGGGGGGTTPPPLAGAPSSSAATEELAPPVVSEVDGDLSGASPEEEEAEELAPAPPTTADAEEAASRAALTSPAVASGGATSQRMDLADEEEGLHLNGNAPAVESIDQIGIEKNLSSPINTVEEDKLCDALMALGCKDGVPSSHWISSTNSDDATRQQLALVAEEARKMPSIGDKEPLSAVASDFPSDIFVIQEKIKGLGEKYVSFRRSRRDGNCFYRCFIFSYLERVFSSRDEECEQEAFRILETVEKYKSLESQECRTLGKPGSLFENHYSESVDLILHILGRRSTSLQGRC